MCRKVVEFGVVCECCAAWFHATELCCGDALANAFQAGDAGEQDAWCCVNCFPEQGEGVPPSDEKAFDRKRVCAEKAAKQGQKNAQNNLGCMYESYQNPQLRCVGGPGGDVGARASARGP